MVQTATTTTSSPIRVVIVGAAGRMGKTLLAACAESSAFEIVGATEAKGNVAVGIDCGVLSGVGANGVTIISEIKETLKKAQVVIDFSLPDSTVANAKTCAAAGCAMVIGTTGLDEQQVTAIETATPHIPIVYSPSMSIGMNLCFELIAKAASVLAAEADIEIIEAHHRNKIDAPSGTALKIGRIVANALGQELDQCAVYNRQPHSTARERNTIGFHAIRGGDITGEHTVLFASHGERVEITHRASHRMSFARGALMAARWVIARPPGMYTMRNVLGFEG